MSADARALLTLKCGPPLDKEPPREEIKLAEGMASILKDFEARQLEVDEDEQLEVMEEQEEDWDAQDELIDVERQASSGHMITFSGGTLVSEEKGCIVHMFHFNRLQFSATFGILFLLSALQVFGCILCFTMYDRIKKEMLYYY